MLTGAAGTLVVGEHAKPGEALKAGDMIGK